MLEEKVGEEKKKFGEVWAAYILVGSANYPAYQRALFTRVPRLSGFNHTLKCFGRCAGVVWSVGRDILFFQEPARVPQELRGRSS